MTDDLSGLDYRQLFEAGPTPSIVIAPPHFEIVTANNAYLEATGTERAALLGRRLFDVFSDDPNDPSASGVANLRASLERVCRLRRPDAMFIQRYPIRAKDGTFVERWWSPINTPVLSPTGAVSLIIHQVVDVTEAVGARDEGDTTAQLSRDQLINGEKQFRKQVEQSEARFRLITNSVPQILWTGKPDGDVDWHNDKYIEYSGRPASTHFQSTESPLHPDDVALTAAAWQHSVATGVPFEVEHRLRRVSDGQYRWHVARAMRVNDAHGRVLQWVGSTTEIHDQKITSQRLAEEIEMREQFVATLSHDLRTPLSAALMSAQVLLKRPDDRELAKTLNDRIVINLTRVDRMVQDLLDAHQAKAGRPLHIEFSHCDLKAIVLDVAETLASVHGDRFTVQVAESIEGRWSGDGIQRMVENLCTNGIKYGAVDRRVTITLLPLAEHAEIRVHNWGRPILSEEREILFEPHWRAASAQTGLQKGWGLGLALVRGVAEAHGGNVRVDSSEDQGTTFIVNLPRNADRPTSTARA